ncbi:MAG: orotidine-5'-phosphate decarboxylase [Chloroflexi bacterium]|nr:orotidine-5'-phosphate decarboxylase [Chloroflexota bacterium]
MTTRPSFQTRLDEAVRAHQSLLCVGLDPDPALLTGRDLFEFGRAIVEATVDLTCAFKLNVAFYEAQGAEGYRALARTVETINGRVPAIADAKRNDIGNSARFYARGLFTTFGFDAATVNPYLGFDGVEPFLEFEDRGIFILCRTSNPGARDLQDLLVELEGYRMPLYEAVAHRARAWNTRGNVGLVAGATYPAEARRIRELCPEMPLLVPGVGAQGGELEAAVHATLNARGSGILVNVSRAILYASTGPDFADAARVAAEAWRRRIEAAQATR